MGARTHCDVIMRLRIWHSKNNSHITSLITMDSSVAEINETKSSAYLALMPDDVEDIFLQLYQVYFITIRTQNIFYYGKRSSSVPYLFMQQNGGLNKSSETYISNSCGGESSSSSMLFISDNSNVFPKPNASLFVVFTIFTLVFSSSDQHY